MALPVAQALSVANKNRLALLAGFSLANLVLLPAWADLKIIYSDQYLGSGLSAQRLYAYTLASVLALGLILARSAAMAHGSPSAADRAFSRIALVGASAFGSFNLAANMFRQGPQSALVMLVVLSVMPGLLIAAAISRGRVFERKLILGAAMLFPLLLFNVAETTAWAHTGLPREARQQHSGNSTIASAPQRRVVWVVFDEFDGQLAFANRPPGTDLPNLDRLAARSISATHAVAAGHFTDESIPAMLLGREVVKGTGTHEGEFLLRMSDGRQVPFSRTENVFTAAKRHGVRSAVVGWHHAYCRALGAVLDSCKDYPNVDASESHRGAAYLESLSASEAMKEYLVRYFDPSRSIRRQDGLAFRDITVREIEYVRRRQASEIVELHARGLAVMADRNYQLVFVHYPIPHPPGIFDRAWRRVSGNTKSTYLDNYALVDQVLGEIQATFTRDNLWSDTTLIVTGDHGLRTLWQQIDPSWDSHMQSAAERGDATRVVFLIAGGDASQPIRVDHPFRTIHTGQIVQKLLAGELSSPASIARSMELLQ